MRHLGKASSGEEVSFSRRGLRSRRSIADLERLSPVPLLTRPCSTPDYTLMRKEYLLWDRKVCFAFNAD